ncbi:MAG: META domain-containing protein [Bacteroidia bacterium]|nr:META domain-containing protein [Bacteroidia bacterium]
MLQGNNIKFLGIGTTKVACNNPLQNSLLVILEKAVKYQIKPGSLLIQTDKGESAEFAFQGND